MKNRFIVLVLAFVMLFALCACGGNQKEMSGEVSYDIPEGKVIPDDATLEIMISSHPSWPYDENWKTWEYVKEAVGGNINIIAVPESDFSTKFGMMLAAPEMFPDLINFGSKSKNFGSYCEQGVFLPFEDYEEFLPDYKRFWDSVPEDERWMVDTRIQADGKIYYTPVHGLERSTNIRGWLYRKDIFDKHGLKTPETMDELYTVSKKLKKLYPNSYPFSIRNALNNIGVIGASRKEDFAGGVYYDFSAEKWCYGPREEKMRDIITFLNKMVSEGLVAPNCNTMSTPEWEELITTNRGFIMPEYQVRIDFFNKIARKNNPEFTMAAMMPPKADGGSTKVNKFNNPPQGYSVPNTGNAGNIANAFRFINWLYTDEACELVSWGKEGETYEIINGEKTFIKGDESQSVQSLYGVNTHGLNIRFDPDAIGATISKEQYDVTDFLLEHTVENLNPATWIPLSEEESERIAELSTTLNTFVSENLEKFLIGAKPLSEWDTFQEELSELPIDELLAIYEKAYNRVK